MMWCYMNMIRKNDGKVSLKGFLLVASAYTVFCVYLNALYHAKLSAYAWCTDLPGLISSASLYSDRVTGYGSFLIHTVGYFYLFKFFLVSFTAFLLAKVLGQKEEDICYCDI